MLVDNASSDGTVDAVRAAYPDVRVLALPRNTGGAGGFALGVADALGRGADLLWLLDDDGVPEPGALAALVAARARRTRGATRHRRRWPARWCGWTGASTA